MGEKNQRDRLWIRSKWKANPPRRRPKTGSTMSPLCKKTTTKCHPLIFFVSSSFNAILAAPSSSLFPSLFSIVLVQATDSDSPYKEERERERVEAINKLIIHQPSLVFPPFQCSSSSLFHTSPDQASGPYLSASNSSSHSLILLHIQSFINSKVNPFFNSTR